MDDSSFLYNLNFYTFSAPFEILFFSGLFARLAEHSIGFINWNSYLPLMFARIQKMFHLPVVFNKTNVGGKACTIDCNAAARWIVSTIGGTSETMTYLKKMFDSLESYFHPANFGR